MPLRAAVAQAPKTMGFMIPKTKLFILHGWTYAAQDTWKRLLEMLARRSVDFEFLNIPGLSDGSDPVWTLDEYVEWLNKKVGGEKVILFGHSNGGRICLAFAAKYPEKVARLIIEDSSGIPPSGPRKLKRDVFRIVAKSVGAIIRSDGARKLLYKIIRESDYVRASPNMRKTMANLTAVDIRTKLSLITAPTLIIWGAGDTTTPLKAGEAIHRGIRGAKMVVIPGARHSPHITHPLEVAEIVVDFISS